MKRTPGTFYDHGTKTEYIAVLLMWLAYQHTLSPTQSATALCLSMKSVDAKP
jgi:hypothetical protein